DPSGRESAREPLTEQEVKKNFATYKKQAKLVLDLNKVKVKFNHEWLGKLKFKDVVELASNFTVQQMLKRDMYMKNILMVKCRQCSNSFRSPIQFAPSIGLKYQPHLEGNKVSCPICKQMTPLENRDLFYATQDARPIGLHEFLYPLMVGYDSVVLDVDAEIGGNDQLFNMLCGRTLQQTYKKREKFVLTTKLLEGTDGRKMSKTYDNCIYLTDKPDDMYGKIMSIKDELIVPYFEACTNVPADKIAAVAKELAAKQKPKTYKAQLAREIVTLYHNAKAATAAEAEFNSVHRDKAMPADVPTVKIPAGQKSLAITDLLVHAKLAPSKAQARRLVEQGGVKVGGKVIADWRTAVALKSGLVIQVGSRKFVKLG
ncbi:MAG TPA: tyrosine--tRNA ligase, partial [Acinetobacter junii]|nr:tyrosine--tRNA ligase [Acinetobacter junii]